MQLTKSIVTSQIKQFYSTTTKNDSIQTTSSSLQPPNKVIIVGAGLSGLSAADHLIKNGVKEILVLEAANRYGGRIHTVKLDEAVCELGAKWINANDNPGSLFSLAQQGGLIDRRSFDSSQENFFIINKETMDEDIVQLVSVLFRDMIKGAEKYLHQEVPIDERTADMYFKKIMNKILAKMPPSEVETTKSVFNTLMRNLSCQLGSDLGYIHVKHLANIAKYLNNPVCISSGLDSVFKQLVKNIPVDRLLLGKPISKIKWADLAPNEKPWVTCLDGDKYHADHVICTIPLGALNVFSQYFFAPNLPEIKTEAIKKLGRGSPGKIYLLYKEPVTSWFIGSVMLGVHQEGIHSRDNWTSGISEVATLPDSRKVLEVKIGGPYNETAERITEEIMDREITDTLRKVMKNNKIPHPKEIIRSFWSTDARTLCGLPYISVESTETCVKDLAAPLGPNETHGSPTLLFAGDATKFEGFGTVEAARSSGIREAQRVLDMMK